MTVHCCRNIRGLHLAVLGIDIDCLRSSIRLCSLVSFVLMFRYPTTIVQLCLVIEFRMCCAVIWCHSCAGIERTA